MANPNQLVLDGGDIPIVVESGEGVTRRQLILAGLAALAGASIVLTSCNKGEGGRHYSHDSYNEDARRRHDRDRGGWFD